MLTNNNEQSSFENNIKEAINLIKVNKYELARNYLHEAMIKNDHSAKIHNLLGVISEHEGDIELACKYYRAACTFDESYKPADRNLERITSFFYIFKESSIDYGDNVVIKEKDNLNLLEYSAMHIGNFKNGNKNIKTSA